MNQTEPLSQKQLRAISIVLQSPSITAGVKKAGVAKTTWFGWMKNPDFKTEFKRQSREAVDEAFQNLKAASIEAVKELRKLLKNRSPKIRLGASKTILEIISKAVLQQEIQQQLEELERRIGD